MCPLECKANHRLLTPDELDRHKTLLLLLRIGCDCAIVTQKIRIDMKIVSCYYAHPFRSQSFKNKSFPFLNGFCGLGV